MIIQLRPWRSNFGGLPYQTRECELNTVIEQVATLCQTEIFEFSKPGLQRNIEQALKSMKLLASGEDACITSQASFTYIYICLYIYIDVPPRLGSTILWPSLGFWAPTNFEIHGSLKTFLPNLGSKTFQPNLGPKATLEPRILSPTGPRNVLVGLRSPKLQMQSLCKTAMPNPDPAALWPRLGP